MCSRNNFCTQNYTHFENELSTLKNELSTLKNELFILNETLGTKLTIPECDDLISLFVIFLILATFIYLSCKYIIKTILDENKKYSTQLVNSLESKQSIQIQTIREEFRSELEKTTSQFKKIDDDIRKLKAQFQECYDQNQNILSQLDSARGELTDYKNWTLALETSLSTVKEKAESLESRFDKIGRAFNQ